MADDQRQYYNSGSVKRRRIVNYWGEFLHQQRAINAVVDIYYTPPNLPYQENSHTN